MIVVTGGSGRLGRALAQVLDDARFPTRHDMDILDSSSVNRYIQLHLPHVLLHVAAMTDVRTAELDRERCWTTNVGGTENIVSALKAYKPDCLLVYVSTACVFDGDRGNYSEEDIPHPKNFYGISKLVGEYVAKRMENSLIVRTNFVAKEPWPYPRAFTDRFGSYLFADDVAIGMQRLIDRRKTGLVHLTGTQRMSMFELARRTTPDVEAMTMAEVTVPLTIDMTLCSLRIDALEIDGHSKSSK